MKGSSDSTGQVSIDELAADSYARSRAQLAAPDRRRSLTAHYANLETAGMMTWRPHMLRITRFLTVPPVPIIALQNCRGGVTFTRRVRMPWQGRLHFHTQDDQGLLRASESHRVFGSTKSSFSAALARRATFMGRHPQTFTTAAIPILELKPARSLMARATALVPPLI
jgi:hypothetical protein